MSAWRTWENLPQKASLKECINPEGYLSQAHSAFFYQELARLKGSLQDLQELDNKCSYDKTPQKFSRAIELLKDPGKDQQGQAISGILTTKFTIKTPTNKLSGYVMTVEGEAGDKGLQRVFDDYNTRAQMILNEIDLQIITAGIQIKSSSKEQLEYIIPFLNLFLPQMSWLSFDKAIKNDKENYYIQLNPLQYLQVPSLRLMVPITNYIANAATGWGRDTATTAQKVAAANQLRDLCAAATIDPEARDKLSTYIEHCKTAKTQSTARTSAKEYNEGRFAKMLTELEEAFKKFPLAQPVTASSTMSSSTTTSSAPMTSTTIYSGAPSGAFATATASLTTTSSTNLSSLLTDSPVFTPTPPIPTTTTTESSLLLLQ